jgi:glycosyltransferase involved in cell wall biosynthesis
MNTRLKVLFLASWYPNRDNPVSGIFIKRHAEAVSRYCDVAVLYVHQDQHTTSTKVEYSIEGGIKTFRVYSKKSHFKNPLLRILYGFFNNYLINSYKGLKIIKLKFGKPDIIHVNVTMPAGLTALFIKKIKGIKYIITEHWSGYTKNDNSFIKVSIFSKLKTKMVIRNAYAVTTVSHDLAVSMQDHGLNNRYYVIPNVVDTDLFCPLSDKTNNIKKKMIHVSLLSHEKNILGILHVIKKLSLKRQDFELDIVGDGPDRPVLEQIANDLGIKNKSIFFSGMKSPKEIAQMERLSDFFIMFSNYENLPCVLIEAFASGLPVIATKVGGIPEHISHKNGVLVNPADEVSLLLSIEFMLDNYSKFNANDLRKYALDNFSFEVVSKQFYDLYIEALK